MIDHAKLRRLAEDATPGNRVIAKRRGELATVCTTNGICISVQPHLMKPKEWACRDGAFIAAANPTTIIELLDEIDRLKAERMHDK